VNNSINKIRSVISDIIRRSKHEYILEPVAERHGSWEIIAHSEEKKHFEEPYEEPNRYLIVALTEVGPWYEIEFWAGADNNRRFTRQLVSSMRTDEEQLKDTSFIDDFKPRLEVALDRAEALQFNDLTEVYPPPRPTRG